MKLKQMLLLVMVLLISSNVYAYIGPGAGIPIIGSLLGMVVTVVLVVSAVLFWPIRKLLKRRKSNSSDKSEHHSEADSES